MDIFKYSLNSNYEEWLKIYTYSMESIYLVCEAIYKHSMESMFKELMKTMNHGSL